MGAAPRLCFRNRRLQVPQTEHELGVRAFFFGADSLINTTHNAGQFIKDDSDHTTYATTIISDFTTA